MKTTFFCIAALAIAGIAHGQGVHHMDMARYGGPTYTGRPALNVTSSLLSAGGGATSFSAAQALTAMVGKETVTKEVGKLTKQYGKKRIGKWLAVFDFAVADAVKIVTKAKIQLPEPSIQGTALAGALVKAAMDKHGVIYTELLLDKALSHGIHDTVMDDIDAKYGGGVDLDYHRITNQMLYDLAKAFKVKGAHLAKLH